MISKILRNFDQVALFYYIEFRKYFPPYLQYGRTIAYV